MYLRAVPFNMGLSNFGICTLEWKLGWGKDGNCVHFLHCFRVLTGVWFSPVCPRSAGIKCCWATDSFSAFNFYTWMETWSWNENNRVWRTGKSLRLFPWMDLHEPVDSIIWLYIFNGVQIYLRTWITRLATRLHFERQYQLLVSLRCTTNGHTWHTAIVLLCQSHASLERYSFTWWSGQKKIQILAGDGHDSGVQTNNSRPSSTCRGVGLIQGTSVYCDWVHSIGRSER